MWTVGVRSLGPLRPTSGQAATIDTFVHLTKVTAWQSLTCGLVLEGHVEPDDFTQILEQQARANDAMFAGDPEPYMAMWSHSNDVSLFGAWGPCKVGWDAVAPILRWVGRRFGGGRMTFDVQVAHAGTETAYAVAYERGEVVLDGAPARPTTIRVTHVYRRVDGQWRIVHRHGDFAPMDESPR